MHTRLSRGARWLYLAGMVLALVLLIPAAWFPFQLGKVAIFALLMLPAVILFTAGGGARELMRSHGVRWAMLAALLPLTYLLSWAVAQNKYLGLSGFTIETDTVVFTVLGFLAFILAFVLFRTLRTVHLLTRVVFWGLVFAGLFQVVVLAFGSGLVPFEIFTDRSVNLLGKWNDLGLLMGLLALMALTALELGSLSGVRFAGVLTLLVLLAFLVGIVNFAFVWALILVFSLALALVKFMNYRAARNQAEDPYAALTAGSKVPWYALGASALSVVFLFFGASFNSVVTSIIPVASLEVRPSYESTLEVIGAAREGSVKGMFIGNGPNTFGDAWLMHKPAEVNQTPFWSLDFNVGFSTLLTAFGTVGFLGVVAWLIPLFLVLAALVRAVRLGVLSREERVAAATVSIGALFLMAAIIFYVPSQNTILLALIFCGAAFGFLWRQGRSNSEPAEFTRLGTLLSAVVALVLMLVTLWSAGIVGWRAVSTSLVQSSTAALAAGEYDTGLARATRAARFEETPDTLRTVVTAGALKLEQIANTEATPENTTALQTEFTALVQQTVDAGQRLVEVSGFDYRSHLALARVFNLLTALNVQGALESARASYNAAIALNPTNPAIPLALARLAASQNDLAGSEQEVTKALTLKPNYTDAMLFVVQLRVAQNDLAQAIDAALAAAQSAPGVAPIWFQLGLLLYTNGDTTNAIAAFEQAVTLVPDYANAKYFLGLGYADAGRAADAIRQFEEIQRTNPDNAEIQIILGNLRQGKQPFEGVQPPPTPPEERAAAPVSE